MPKQPMRLGEQFPQMECLTLPILLTIRSLMAAMARLRFIKEPIREIMAISLLKVLLVMVTLELCNKGLEVTSLPTIIGELGLSMVWPIPVTGVIRPIQTIEQM